MADAPDPVYKTDALAMGDAPEDEAEAAAAAAARTIWEGVDLATDRAADWGWAVDEPKPWFEELPGLPPWPLWLDELLEVVFELRVLARPQRDGFRWAKKLDVEKYI